LKFFEEGKAGISDEPRSARQEAKRKVLATGYFRRIKGGEKEVDRIYYYPKVKVKGERHKGDLAHSGIRATP